MLEVSSAKGRGRGGKAGKQGGRAVRGAQAKDSARGWKRATAAAASAQWTDEDGDADEDGWLDGAQVRTQWGCARVGARAG